MNDYKEILESLPEVEPAKKEVVWEYKYQIVYDGSMDEPKWTKEWTTLRVHEYCRKYKCGVVQISKRRKGEEGGRTSS